VKHLPFLLAVLLFPSAYGQRQVTNPAAPKLNQSQQSAGAVPPTEIEITPVDPSMGVSTGISVARGGFTYLSVSNARPDQLLALAHGIPADRVKVNDELGKATYDMTVRAAAIYASKTEDAVDEEIESVCGVNIERNTSIRDVYVLKAVNKYMTLPDPIFPYVSSQRYPYQVGSLQLDFRFASLDLLTDALEQVLNTPVLDESGVHGRLTASFKFVAADYEPVKAGLEKSTGFTLIPARRSVEIFTIRPKPDPYSSDPSQ
jgi:hypothetical protein